MNESDYVLPIILWSWGSRFPDEHIAKMKSMLHRHLRTPHRFVVISDSKMTRERFHAEGDQVIPLWNDLRERGKCLVRLKVFKPEFREIIGPRFAWFDLDMVVVDDVAPIFTRPESFIMSGVELPPQPVNGSLVIMDAGVAPEVFTEFDYNLWQNNVKGRGKRYGGSDQAWIGLKANDKITKITREDGLYCYRDDIAPRDSWPYESWKRRSLVDGLKHDSTNGTMPAGARIIQCNGPWGPHTPRVQKMSPWLVKHWS